MKTNNNIISVNAQSYTHPNPTELTKNRKKKFKSLRGKKNRSAYVPSSLFELSTTKFYNV